VPFTAQTGTCYPLQRRLAVARSPAVRPDRAPRRAL